MTIKDFQDIAEAYKKKDSEYADLLFYILSNCHEDFLPLFEKAESENKKLYLIDGYPELQHADLLVEAYVELEDISAR